MVRNQRTRRHKSGCECLLSRSGGGGSPKTFCCLPISVTVQMKKILASNGKKNFELENYRTCFPFACLNSPGFLRNPPQNHQATANIILQPLLPNDVPVNFRASGLLLGQSFLILDFVLLRLCLGPRGGGSCDVHTFFALLDPTLGISIVMEEVQQRCKCHRLFLSCRKQTVHVILSRVTGDVLLASAWSACTGHLSGPTHTSTGSMPNRVMFLNGYQARNSGSGTSRSDQLRKALCRQYLEVTCSLCLLHRSCIKLLGGFPRCRFRCFWYREDIGQVRGHEYCFLSPGAPAGTRRLCIRFAFVEFKESSFASAAMAALDGKMVDRERVSLGHLLQLPTPTDASSDIQQPIGSRQKSGSWQLHQNLSGESPCLLFHYITVYGLSEG
eukprot:284817791_1